MIEKLQVAATASLLMFTATTGVFAETDQLKFAQDDGSFISVKAPALYPEGLEYDPLREQFLLGSVRQGKVVSLDHEGSVKTLVDDDRLRQVIGIRVDAERGRLLINNSDYGLGERSKPEDKFGFISLAVYDLETGSPIQFVNLSNLRPGEAKFVNDLTIDVEGNAYITDSLAAAIYKVTPSGSATVFLTNERFRSEGFNLNGIQYHDDGYLLVAKKSDGALFKIPLDDPQRFTEVRLPKPLVGTDGLVLVSGNELVAITNLASGVESNTVFQLISNDGWESAEIGETFETGNVYPTTGTVVDGKLFVNYGQLNTLGGAVNDGAEFESTFRIQEVGSK
ncbi:hypothetical protein [Roseibium sp. SCP14]|uniref:hypothetical protein n=1 Tax=Roseibium sp. SCP14 TaxID=3141375 RepID=UPI00333DDED9